jgi:hypothetical protein
MTKKMMMMLVSRDNRARSVANCGDEEKEENDRE